MVAQLKLLLWKNFLVQRRQVTWSVFSLLFPLTFMAVLLIIRQLVSVLIIFFQKKHLCHETYLCIKKIFEVVGLRPSPFQIKMYSESSPPRVAGSFLSNRRIFDVCQNKCAFPMGVICQILRC